MSYAKESAVMFRCSLSAAYSAARESVVDKREFSVGYGPHLPYHKKGN
jgi:hypothetical protein